MSKRIFLVRLWCKQCEMYEFHTVHKPHDDAPNVYSCIKCATNTDGSREITIEDSEKYEEQLTLQRNRWREQKLHMFPPQYDETLNLADLDEHYHIKESAEDVLTVIESDAGAKYMLGLHKARMQDIAAKYAPQIAKYTGAAKQGRNEKCDCNSGKKFKHCCINKEQQLIDQRQQEFMAETMQFETACYGAFPVKRNKHC